MKKSSKRGLKKKFYDSVEMDKLAELVFDMKEKLTDEEYKNIMDCIKETREGGQIELRYPYLHGGWTKSHKRTYKEHTENLLEDLNFVMSEYYETRDKLIRAYEKCLNINEED